MNIALLAHDKRKELLVQFCIAYCGILSEHNLGATRTTGQLITEVTGLPVQLYLSCTQGGSQQIGARIVYNEIDFVIFFRDPHNLESDCDDLVRLCDEHNIPFASNLATAEVLIRGLDRGDMDWRNIVQGR